MISFFRTIIVILIFLLLGAFLFYPDLLSWIKDKGKDLSQDEKIVSWSNLLKGRLEEHYQESKEEIKADPAWQATKDFFKNFLKEKLTEIFD
jgi:hypothetical protein